MNKLTKEEAIKILKDTLYDEKTPTDYLEAVKMGREALENQKSVVEEFEKLKAEIIEQIKYFIQYKGDKDYDLGSYDAYNYMLSIVNEQIAELREE